MKATQYLIILASFFMISASYAEESLHCLSGKSHQILLTFDDGPHLTRTPKVLNVLREEGVRALFFISGAATLRASRDKMEPLLKQMRNEGHAIGYHAFEHWAHDKMLKNNENYVLKRNPGVVKNKEEFEKTNDKYSYIPISEDLIWRNLFRGLSRSYLRDYVGPFFRLPYGDGADNPKLIEHIEQRGFRNFHWQMDSLDYMSRQYSFSERVYKVQQSLCHHKGGIMLMHDIQPHASQELKEWIRLMREAGHELVGPDKIRHFVN